MAERTQLVAAERHLGRVDPVLRRLIEACGPCTLRSLAGHVRARKLGLSALRQVGDEEVIARLTGVKGIGQWTAQVFMIFRLGRLDVLPVNDLGLLEGARILYGFPERPSVGELIDLAEPWRPYRSVGCWYLWRERRRWQSEPARE